MCKLGNIYGTSMSEGVAYTRCTESCFICFSINVSNEVMSTKMKQTWPLDTHMLMYMLIQSKSIDLGENNCINCCLNWKLR